MVHELTPRLLDAISGTGEMLAAPLVAGAIARAGPPSSAIDATEVVVTTDQFGGAEPLMDDARTKMQAHVRPLHRARREPVVTGFIGATVDGVLTTLGRGGSDYSASIVGAALDADEVWIWTDVDGVLTANPSEVSGRADAAGDLLQRSLGAGVLRRQGPSLQDDPAGVPQAHPGAHPQQLQPDASRHARQRRGRPVDPGVKAVTSIRGVSLIAISGTGMQGIPGIVAKAFDVVAEQQSNVLMISQASSENNICFVITRRRSAARGQGAARGARDRAARVAHRGDRRSRWRSWPPSATACAARRGSPRPSSARWAPRDQRHRDLARVVRAEHLPGRGRARCRPGDSGAASRVSSRPRERRPFGASVHFRTRIMPVRDVLIVGAGPSGLATAIAAKQHGLDYVIVEKGVLVNSIFNFPMLMVFFTTPELLEIGGLPLVTPYDKPTRLEALRYYRRVVDTFGLQVSFHETVRQIDREDDGTFAVTTKSRERNASEAGASRGPGDRLLRSAQLPGCPGRGSAARLALLHRRASVLPAARRGRRRKELSGRGGTGALPRRCARHARPSARRRSATRSSTGSGPTSRTASRKGRSQRGSNRASSRFAQPRS